MLLEYRTSSNNLQDWLISFFYWPRMISSFLKEKSEATGLRVKVSKTKQVDAFIPLYSRFRRCNVANFLWSSSHPTSVPVRLSDTVNTLRAVLLQCFVLIIMRNSLCMFVSDGLGGSLRCRLCWLFSYMTNVVAPYCGKIPVAGWKTRLIIDRKLFWAIFSADF